MSQIFIFLSKYTFIPSNFDFNKNKVYIKCESKNKLYVFNSEMRTSHFCPVSHNMLVSPNYTIL